MQSNIPTVPSLQSISSLPTNIPSISSLSIMPNLLPTLPLPVIQGANPYPYQINYDTLDENSVKSSQPDLIKIPLKDNQLTILNFSENLEKNNRLKVNNKMSFNTNVIIIGEKVGGGKSATCLGIIANNPVISQNETIETMGQYITIYKSVTTAILPINIIVVPHTIFRQWKKYIEQFIDTDKLSVLMISDSKHIPTDPTTAAKKLSKYQIILVPNKKYNALATMLNGYRVCRLFVDEADSIDIPNFRRIEACKYYFITASIETLRRCRVKNNGMLKEICGNINICPNDIFKLIVAKNKDDFVEKSFALPDPIMHTIRCKSPNAINILYGIVSNDIIQMINAGDIQSVIEKYKIQTFNETNVVELICKNYMIEIENRRVDLEATKRKTFHSEDYKKQAILKIQDEIRDLEAKIAGIESRIKDTSCPICLDDFKNKAVTPCCQNVFCFECISMILTQKNQCPMCRKTLKSIKDIIVIGDKDSNVRENAVEDELKDKNTNFTACIVKLIAERGADLRLLVFSEYENSFNGLPEILAKNGVPCSRLMGTAAHIDNVVNDYRAGNTKSLLLNARYFGSGLNMENTTDIIIYHRMNPDLEKQVVGRAQRPGRKGQLHIWKLAYENEE